MDFREYRRSRKIVLKKQMHFPLCIQDPVFFIKIAFAILF